MTTKHMKSKVFLRLLIQDLNKRCSTFPHHFSYYIHIFNILIMLEFDETFSKIMLPSHEYFKFYYHYGKQVNEIPKESNSTLYI